jgi:hypothetical protein
LAISAAVRRSTAGGRCVFAMTRLSLTRMPLWSPRRTVCQAIGYGQLGYTESDGYDSSAYMY